MSDPTIRHIHVAVWHTTCALCKATVVTSRERPSRRRDAYLRHVERNHREGLDRHDRSLLADAMLRDEVMK